MVIAVDLFNTKSHNTLLKGVLVDNTIPTVVLEYLKHNFILLLLNIILIMLIRLLYSF